ncbi:MAG: hypothetical protein INH41_07265 [Myxococcaceae bacterium]|jgi:hypothetical protein|nr:hypothetical protein [Myxococcaceae bacterium]MCA3012185.1 hypothetical protein [Myxococcaceae bacterium]
MGWSKQLRVAGLVTLGAAIIPGALVVGVGVMLWSSRRTSSAVDALVARTTPGTSLEQLLDDPFVQRSAHVSVRGPFTEDAEYPDADDAARRRVLTRLRALAPTATGSLSLMWYSLPPFGRLFLDVTFEAGLVTHAKSSSLD